MHIVTVIFEANPGHEADLHGALLVQAAASLTEAGCTRFDVGVDPRRPGRFFLYEIYRTPADFDIHLKTAHFDHFNRTTAPWVASKLVEQWTMLPPFTA